MNQTQSIIVYRNPWEQAFWESTTTFDNFIPLFCGLVVMVILVAVCDHYFPKHYQRMSGFHQPVRQVWWSKALPWAIGILGGLGIMRYLWI